MNYDKELLDSIRELTEGVEFDLNEELPEDDEE